MKKNIYINFCINYLLTIFISFITFSMILICDNKTENTFNENQIFYSNNYKNIDHEYTYYNYKLKLSREKSKNISLMYQEERKNKNSHLPNIFKFKKIDENQLKSFLEFKESLLVYEPYFSTILNTAEKFNLNPLLLFAICGQEQSFVPIHHNNSIKIANNPFNVFNSWQVYNTDIKDSSEIASRTVVNLCVNLPKDSDPFKWINKKYSEDPNWHKGVKSIFKELEYNVRYIY